LTLHDRHDLVDRVTLANEEEAASCEGDWVLPVVECPKYAHVFAFWSVYALFIDPRAQMFLGFLGGGAWGGDHARGLCLNLTG